MLKQSPEGEFGGRRFYLFVIQEVVIISLIFIFGKKLKMGGAQEKSLQSEKSLNLNM